MWYTKLQDYQDQGIRNLYKLNTGIINVYELTAGSNTLFGLSDTDVGTVLPGNTIVWNGNSWVPATGVTIPAAFYTDDADAASNGVLIDQVYKLAQNNIYGLPKGTPKVRTV